MEISQKIANILLADKEISKLFKIISHPFDPTDETVRTDKIINVEYNGETVDTVTNKTMGGIQRYICRENYNINLYYKTSRNLNSGVIYPHVERIVNILSNTTIDEEEISNLFLTYEGVEKVDRKDAFYMYKVKFSLKKVR